MIPSTSGREAIGDDRSSTKPALAPGRVCAFGYESVLFANGLSASADIIRET
jgi:hypothetical protein